MRSPAGLPTGPVAKPGPPPRPVELTRRLGNPGHRSELPVASAPIGDVVEAATPSVELPPYARALWDEVVPVLARFSLRTTDLPAIEAMCMAYARMMQARDVINRQGLFALGSTGQMVEHPAFKIEQQASRTFLAYAGQFGLTWVARSNLGLTEATRGEILSRMSDKMGVSPRSE